MLRLQHLVEAGLVQTDQHQNAFGHLRGAARCCVVLRGAAWGVGVQTHLTDPLAARNFRHDAALCVRVTYTQSRLLASM